MTTYQVSVENIDYQTAEMSLEQLDEFVSVIRKHFSFADFTIGPTKEKS